jgi:predicted SnoaL-like aldol condensation-catalyzing enzyme
MLAALITWVEQGQAPGPIVAARRTAALSVDRTRPLCPYPQEAVFGGRGSTDQATSFRCVPAPSAQTSASYSGSKSMTSAQSAQGAAPLFPVTQPIAPDAIAPAAQTSSADYAALTARNRTIMTDFVTLLYERRQPRVAFEKYVHPDYKQHNPIIADGRENALKWLEPVFAKATTEIQVRRLLIDGDYATVQIIGRMGPDDPGSAIINIFHLKDGLIIEHWDVTQAMPKETASGRPLG